MRALYSDTHPQMESLQIRLLRQLSPAQKLQMMAELNASAHLLALNGLRTRHPNLTETQLLRSLASMLLGNELASIDYDEPINIT